MATAAHHAATRLRRTLPPCAARAWLAVAFRHTLHLHMPLRAAGFIFLPRCDAAWPSACVMPLRASFLLPYFFHLAHAFIRRRFSFPRCAATPYRDCGGWRTPPVGYAIQQLPANRACRTTLFDIASASFASKWKESYIPVAAYPNILHIPTGAWQTAGHGGWRAAGRATTPPQNNLRRTLTLHTLP